MTVAGAEQTALLRVLTPENRRLLNLIYSEKPSSVGALCKLASRAQPNVSRALAALEEAGLVRMVGARPKRPELAARFIVIDLLDEER
ncbi:MarR family transcriptional regulator [Bosea vaviloviae]|uniref:Uncharacterized protein n=1 Tax=Bosea vaviloviae TaxID=1526658 RepID=A0A1D7U4C6_9HYPH|nr:hypothetical protein BHK69_18855 [Bosea vaviloviae]